MTRSATSRLDAVNIGLMLLSCAVAFIIPFELFLFSYAILGPLHYLTEISWLHDKAYYTKSRWDALVLLAIGLAVTLIFFNSVYNWGWTVPDRLDAQLLWIALLGSLVAVLVKKPFYRIAGILLIIATSQLSAHGWLFLAVFVPTLVHVYVFTGLFMLYGALKSRSRTGLLAVGVLLLCPVLLFAVSPDAVPFLVSDYGRETYYGRDNDTAFFRLHMRLLNGFFGYPDLRSEQPAGYWVEAVFSSRAGILLMRFIAFAYTYHYLNWFSKTRVIQWHKVPKARFALVLGFWAVSVGLYVWDYAMGLQWLFFLSFLHVLLEFPLNMTSIVGIGSYLGGRIFRRKKSLVAGG